MSYQVLARKWRPRRFEEMVGQAHVVRPLINALDNDRVHHAFLFTGTRGVGKTTVARILAKALNCEKGVSSKPCGECTSCREVDEGRFVDLIEVDAASRTKVDDTRELLDNVQYAPTRGRYKIYLIDEVHMLSTHSFNALLKTLEEPPPHVKFLLATTDPQKLPVTILSRCLQFNLKRIPLEQIEDQLKMITKEEGVEAETAALSLLSRGADGSMRDGLSLLDQAIAYGGGKVSEADVSEMMGTIDQGTRDALLNALIQGDAPALMEAVEVVVEHGGDYEAVLDDILLALHRIALAQINKNLISKDATDFESISSFARQLRPEDTQLFYQIGLHGKRDLYYAPDPRTGLEMALLRMIAFRPAAEGEVVDVDVIESRPGNAPKANASTAQSETKASESKTAAKKSSASAKTNPAGNDWAQVIKKMNVQGLLQQFAKHTSLKQKDGNKIEVILDKNYTQLHTKEREQEFRSALEGIYGDSLKFSLEIGVCDEETPAEQEARKLAERQQAAEDAINDDPNVKALQEGFGASVSPESVKSRV